MNFENQENEAQEPVEDSIPEPLDNATDEQSSQEQDSTLESNDQEQPISNEVVQKEETKPSVKFPQLGEQAKEPEIDPTIKELQDRMEELSRINKGLISLIPPDQLQRAVTGQQTVNSYPQNSYNGIPTPEGFSTWSVGERREWINQSRQRQQNTGYNQLNPVQNQPVEDVARNVVEEYFSTMQKQQQEKEYAEIEKSAVERFNLDAQEAVGEIAKVVNKVPENLKDEIIAKAIERYERKHPGYKAPLRDDVSVDSVILYGENSAPKEFVEDVQFAAFEQGVGYIPDFVLDLYKKNYEVIKGNKKGQAEQQKGTAPKVPEGTKPNMSLNDRIRALGRQRKNRNKE